MKKIETSALIGLGALGILFGRKMPGVKVIADAERIARYSAQPVVCNGKECRFDYVTPEQGQPVDLVLVAVKATVLEQAIKDIKKFVGPDTIIISVLNGITSENDIEAVYPGHCLWSVAIGMDATRVGRSLTFGAEGRIQFGEKSGEMTDRVKAVDEYLTACGIASEPCNDILFKQWSKLMVNDGLNQAAAAFDLPYGGLTKPGPAYDKMLEAMQEVIDLSVLEGVNLAGTGANGKRVVQNLLDALTPILQEGAAQHLQTTAANARAEADAARAAREQACPRTCGRCPRPYTLLTRIGGCIPTSGMCWRSCAGWTVLPTLH